MKWKLILFSLFLGFIYWSCEQDMSSVGMGMLPDEDQSNIYVDTIYFEASTIKLDSIYAKTMYGLLGEFYDPSYGNFKAGYACQFYADSQTFREMAVDDRIDSIILGIQYSSFTGDSLTPMEVSVFPIIRPLEKNYYSNMNLEDYCDLSTPLGRQAFTVRNLNVSDSLNSDIKSIEVRLPRELGQKLYDEWKKATPNAFGSLDAFTEFFPGIYITTTYGTGSIINAELTCIDVIYCAERTTQDVNGEDSTYIAEGAYSSFYATKEIIQTNAYSSSLDAQLLAPNPEKVYIKTPGNIFTKITVPIPDIVEQMKGRKFTNAKFSLTALAQEEWDYSLPFPGNGGTQKSSARIKKMLLINADSVTTFFENQLVADNRTAYSTTMGFDYIYNFNNIANVIQDAMDKAPDRNLELLVIPIVTSTYTSQNTTVDYSSSHFLEPSAVSLKKSREYMKLEITATDMNLSR